MEPVMPKDPEVHSAPAAVEMSEAAAANEEDPAHPETMAFCPTGWLPHGHRCFKLVSSDRWGSVEENCAALDGDLAGAETMDDYNDLHTLAQFFGHTYYWIGGFYFQGVWRWIDGSRFIYNNWHSQNSASSYPCIALRGAGGWVNTNCGYSYPAICVKRAC
ncbi:ladderlectin-like [Engraulis encrasicolus]|uniref:ladderlectin-like n=1 Tax=Engraulis encrasicolus TaxID=184585 RepID=UPI002FD4D7B9